MKRRSLLGPVLLALVSGAAVGCADLISDVIELGTVEVEATRVSGGPVPGVWLVLYTGNRPIATGETDEDGRHVFRFVPPETYGVYAEPPVGFVRPEDVLGGPTTAYRDGLLIEEGTEIALRFEYMRPGPGAIQVTVAEPDGTPVGGARLSAYSQGHPAFQGTTGPDGTALLDSIPFGNWGVQAEPPLRYRVPAGQLPYTHGIIVEEGVARPARIAMDLAAFEPCAGRVRVEVVDETGQPVPDFPVVLYLSWTLVGEARTGADGTWTFLDAPCRAAGVALVSTAGYEFSYGRGTSYFDGMDITNGSLLVRSFQVAHSSTP